ncbi:FHA domain-containing protein [Agrococcus sp. 1P02AA]|uniref:FHA domain-containing protein n=1 Tax=Agrococcus sp. 1P02AA TaxID=3132259 RepID=UPI0039A72823
MNATIEGIRLEYAAGEAWCIAAGRVVLVCERDLDGGGARALHAAVGSIDTIDALSALVEQAPSALIALVDLDGSRALLRRHGVPAAADGVPLPDRFGQTWSIDEVPASESVAAGGIPALEGDTLPFEGGVVRVSAVRVAPRETAAPTAPAEESAGAEEQASLAHTTGAFGQTLPPAERGAPAASAPPATSSPAASAPPDASAAHPAPAASAPPAAPRAESAAPDHAIGGLIDSVPGFIKPAADVRVLADAPTAEPAPTPAAGIEQPASDPAAAARAMVPNRATEASQETPDAGAAAPRDEGDHDGMTITAERAQELMAERPQSTAAPATGPLVLSTLCRAGHVNPPGTQQCATCGAAVDERSAAQRRRPEVAMAELPSGERVPLGRGVVIGRRPRSRRVEDGRVPRLITVESPSEDISRSHLELRVEDWNLVAVDLSSTNGTLLLREGSAPQRLRPEASTILQLGDRLDLGDDVVISIQPATDEDGR